jgi:uncharacterized protein (DUF885 family)
MKRSSILLFLTGAVVVLLAGCGPQQKTDQAGAATETSATGNASFGKLADEFIAGYLAWRPQTGTYLGLHEYDGKVTDYSRASLDAELARLKEYRNRLAQLDTASLNAGDFYDYRLLRSAVDQEIFRFEDLGTYTIQPMTYAGAFDVNIYAQRDFAPLPDRMRSIIAILQKAPQVMAAARQNLRDAGRAGPVCRRRPGDRPQQEPQASIRVHPKGPPDGRQPDPRHAQEPGKHPPVLN